MRTIGLQFEKAKATKAAEGEKTAPTKAKATKAAEGEKTAPAKAKATKATEGEKTDGDGA